MEPALVLDGFVLLYASRVSHKSGICSGDFGFTPAYATGLMLVVAVAFGF